MRASAMAFRGLGMVVASAALLAACAAGREEVPPIRTPYEVGEAGPLLLRIRTDTADAVGYEVVCAGMGRYTRYAIDGGIEDEAPPGGAVCAGRRAYVSGGWTQKGLRSGDRWELDFEAAWETPDGGTVSHAIVRTFRQGEDGKLREATP